MSGARTDGGESQELPLEQTLPGSDPSVEQQDPQQNAEGQEQSQGQQENGEQRPEGEQPPQKRGDKRFAHLTARMAEANRRAEEAERREAELRQMLEARQSGTEGGEQPPRQQRNESDAEFERRVQEGIANRIYQERLGTLISAGQREFGKQEFDEASSIVAGYGANKSQAFMGTLVELDNGPQVVQALSQDGDRLDALLQMTPHKMALEMAKISGELSRTTTQQTARPVSRAPAPARSMPMRGTNPAPNIYGTSSMSMDEYARHRAQTATRRLGGRGEAR